MKKIALTVFALLFWATTGAAAPEQSQSEQDWFLYYYLNKDTSKMPDFLADLQKTRQLEKHPEGVFSIEGFLSVIFAANPGQADNWAHGAAYTGKLKGAIDYAVRHPMTPDTDDIKSTADLDRTWGAYSASGDEGYLLKVVNLLENRKTDKKDADLHAAAAFSLGASMTIQESVNRFLVRESTRRTGPVKDELDKIIATVQKQREARALPNRDGDFSAMMFVTDPKLGASSSHDIIHFKETPHAKIGEDRAIVIVFAGMDLSADYEADVTYNVQITDPGGKVFLDQKDLEAIRHKLPTRFRMFNNKAVVFLKFETKDTPGVYKISATLNDNIGKRAIPLSYALTLEK